MSLPEPYFERSPTASRSRLLLLSYHFPPGQAAGVLRWQKMARFAVERGWELDVVALHPESLPAPDLARLNDLPAGTRVYGVRAPNLLIDRLEHWTWLACKRAWRQRSSGFAPRGDAGSAAAARPESLSREEMLRGYGTRRDIFRAYNAWREYARDGAWAFRAAQLAMEIIQPGLHEAVVSCGPPHMVHEAARRIGARTSLPFVVDLRDPWSLVQRLPEAVASPLWLRLAARYERRAIGSASLIVSNTERANNAFKAAYPEAADRCVTVMNGFDDDTVPPSVPSERFVLAYAGAIYLDRDPSVLFGACAQVIRDLQLTPAEFGIELMGTVQSYNGLSLERTAEEMGLRGFVHVHPPASRREAMEFLAGAAMLVSLPQDSDMAIPSKIFEYMKFDAWILAMAEPGSATDEVLSSEAADVVSPRDVERLSSVICRRYLAFCRGERPTRDASTRYSRAEQAHRLFEALDKVIGRRRHYSYQGAEVPATRQTGSTTSSFGNASL